ncbi:MAG: peptidase domain-containing ABC transporter [Pseudomonadales bacterium]|nr:peptidase domain-containing ABC transporter [Pseudomonadales bacterium]
MIGQLNFSLRRRLPLIFQSDMAACGEACLQMICRYFGQKVPPDYIRDHCQLGNQGTTLAVLMDAAGLLKFACRAVRCEASELKHFDKPIILHWDFNHYVVLKSSRAGKFIVHDPAVGECHYNQSEMRDHFTGVALELTPTDEIYRLQQTREKSQQYSQQQSQQPSQQQNTATAPSFAMFLESVVGLGPLLFQILVLSLVLQIFALTLPFYTQLIIDEVLSKKNEALLMTLLVGFSIITLISLTTQTLRGWISIYLSHQISYALSSSLFHRVLLLPERFFQNRHMGDIVSRFGSLQPIQSFITSSSIAVLLDGLMAITTLIVITMYSAYLAVIVVATVAIRLALDLLFFSAVKNRQNQHLVACAKLDSSFMEIIRSISSIKRFGVEAGKSNEWLNKLVNSINTNIRLDRLNLGLSTSTMLVQSLGALVIVYAGATEVIKGNMTIGMLIAFLAYRTHLENALGSLVSEFLTYLMLSLHFERLSDFYLANSEIEQCDGEVLDDVSTIALKHVGYSYGKDSPCLFQDLNLRIKRGELIAIFGPSGAGKSTIIRLITGSLRPQQGDVYFDNIPVRLISKQSIAYLVASVMQDDQLFSGSLKDNITLSNNDAREIFNVGQRDGSHHDLQQHLQQHLQQQREPHNASCESPSIQSSWQRLEKAAKLAEIHEHILSLPMGYQTPVGEMGTTLSTGQLQRIFIARALYREPKILVLDEGTAHLDRRLATKIFSNIKQTGMTVIYVTHNYKLLSVADRLFVMHTSSNGGCQLMPHKVKSREKAV